MQQIHSAYNLVKKHLLKIPRTFWYLSYVYQFLTGFLELLLYSNS